MTTTKGKGAGIASAGLLGALLLGGCGGGGSGTETVTVTAGSTSTSSSTPASTSASTEEEPAGDVVDCDPNGDLSQADWEAYCSDVLGDRDDAAASMSSSSSYEPTTEDDAAAEFEMSPVQLDEAYTYPDGLKIRVSNWRAGTDESISEPYVVFDVTMENTSDAPMSVAYWEGALYGAQGETADSVPAEEWETNDRRLQPGAKDTVTGTLSIANVNDPATVQFEFYDPDTYDTPRPNFYMYVNGGVQ